MIISPILQTATAFYMNADRKYEDIRCAEYTISQQLDSKYRSEALAFPNCVVIDVYYNARILENFERRFLANMKDIEPEFMAVINEHIWDLA